MEFDLCFFSAEQHCSHKLGKNNAMHERNDEMVGKKKAPDNTWMCVEEISAFIFF